MAICFALNRLSGTMHVTNMRRGVDVTTTDIHDSTLVVSENHPTSGFKTDRIMRDWRWAFGDV